MNIRIPEFLEQQFDGGSIARREDGGENWTTNTNLLPNLGVSSMNGHHCHFVQVIFVIVVLIRNKCYVLHEII